MIVQGVVTPAPGLDFASKPDVRLGHFRAIGPVLPTRSCALCPDSGPGAGAMG